MYWSFCKRVTDMRVFAMLSLVLVFGWALADGDEKAVAAGKAIYVQTCIACHGANGKGAIPGVADFTSDDGALAKTDEALIKSITEGVQSPGSPMAMPPKGGNPTLTEADIKAVLVYLRDEFGS